MGTGYENFRSFCRILYFYHVKFDTLCRFEYFPFDLLVFCQHGVCLSKINADVASHITLHDSCHNVFFLLKVLIINDLAFFFPDLLEDQVLRVLCRNPSKGF